MLLLTSSNCFVTKDFLRHLPKKPQDLRLTFIPTAAEVETGSLSWLDDDRQALIDAGFPVTDFTFVGKNSTEVSNMLDETDFIFVASGNTFFLLQEMKKSGFADLIQKYVDQGLIYGGSSAGSVVAGPNIDLIKSLDDAQLAPELSDTVGLGLTDVIVLPHWGSAHFKTAYENNISTAYAKGRKIILLTDDQYLLVQDNTYRIESI